MPTRMEARPRLEALEPRNLPSGIWQPILPVLQISDAGVTMVGKQRLPPISSPADDVWLGNHHVLHQINWTAQVNADPDPAGTQAVVLALAAKEANAEAKAERKAAGIQFAGWVVSADAAAPTDAEVKEEVGRLARRMRAVAYDLVRDAQFAENEWRQKRYTAQTFKETLPFQHEAIRADAKAYEATKFALAVAKLTKMPAADIKAAIRDLAAKRRKEVADLEAKARKDQAALDRAVADREDAAYLIYLEDKAVNSAAAAKQAAADLKKLAKVLE